MKRKDLLLKEIEPQLIRTQSDIRIGAAHNLGAKLSATVHINTFDSDDFVVQGALPKLIKSALKSNVDICSGTSIQFCNLNKKISLAI